MSQSRLGRLLRRQLPAGLPQERAPYAPPAPIPRKEVVSQVFTTFDAKPVQSHMFSLTRNAPAQDDPSTGGSFWDFSVTVRPGFVMVLRAVKVGAHVAESAVGSRNSTFYLWSAPGKLEHLLLLNGSQLLDVSNEGNLDNIAFANMGQAWPVYLVAKERDRVTLRVRSYTVWDHGSDSDLDATFYGDYLARRGLPGDLEIGHDAPLVRVAEDGQ